MNITKLWVDNVLILTFQDFLSQEVVNDFLDPENDYKLLLQKIKINPQILNFELIYQPFAMKLNTNLGLYGLKTILKQFPTISKTILENRWNHFFELENGQNWPLKGVKSGVNNLVGSLPRHYRRLSKYNFDIISLTFGL